MFISKRKILLIPVGVYLLGFIFSIFSYACRGKSTYIESGQTNNLNPDTSSFIYDLSKPDVHYRLPSILYEISGIALYNDKEIACIQDEEGAIFIYNVQTEDIIDKIKFGKEGDYEDIEIVDGIIYVLKSNGNLYRVKTNEDGEVKTKTIKTTLSRDNDCEGMCYDHVTHSLLIACKGSGDLEKNDKFKDFKAVYRFDLDENVLDPEPFLVINVQKIFESMDMDSYERLSYKLANYFDPDGHIIFQPSAIAIHPLNGNIYIVASVGKKLIILNRERKILDMHELDKQIFRQPEGIFFNKQGDLYISNEGSGGKGNILMFKMKKESD